MWAKIVGILVVIAKPVLWFLNLMDKYQTEFDAIALRVEKDSADGKWTNAEKVEHAWDIFQKKVYPTLDWKLKLIIKMKGGKNIKALLVNALDKICAKSHALKIEA